jgi:hypothetical protein
MLYKLATPRIMRDTGQYLPTRPSETPKFSRSNSTPKKTRIRPGNTEHAIIVSLDTFRFSVGD